jgi:hypothetical protein
MELFETGLDKYRYRLRHLINGFGTASRARSPWGHRERFRLGKLMVDVGY